MLDRQNTYIKVFKKISFFKFSKKIILLIKCMKEKRNKLLNFKKG